MHAKRRLIVVSAALLAVLLLGAFAFFDAQTEAMGARRAMKKLNKAGVDVEFGRVDWQGGQLGYARYPHPTGKKLLLIHGSPGDWSAWVHIFLDESIRNAFEIVAIDRLGYGGTTLAAAGSLAEQAAAVEAIAQQLWPDADYLVVGHSYGGAVAEEVLLRDPQHARGAVMVAGTLSPAHQQPKWYNKLGRTTAAQYLMPADLKASNLEMLALAGELQANEAALATLAQPMIVIQGQKDVLVPSETADYLAEQVPRATVVLVEDMNHFVPWSHPALIVNAIHTLDKAQFE